jgi:hypothetical protein
MLRNASLFDIFVCMVIGIMIDIFTIADVMICTTYRIRNCNKLKITLNSYEFLDLLKIFEPENQKRIYNS